MIPDVKRRRIGPERITTFPVRICVCRPFGLLGGSKALRRYCRRRNKTKIAHSRRALIEAFRNSLRISSVWAMCLATSERMKPVTGSQSARWRNICYVNEPFGEALPCRRKLGEHGSFHGLIFNMAVIQRPVNLPPSGFSPAGLGSQNIRAHQSQRVERRIINGADRPFQIGWPRPARNLTSGQGVRSFKKMECLQRDPRQNSDRPEGRPTPIFPRTCNPDNRRRQGRVARVPIPAVGLSLRST